jgi:hypothetical protein
VLVACSSPGGASTATTPAQPSPLAGPHGPSLEAIATRLAAISTKDAASMAALAQSIAALPDVAGARVGPDGLSVFGMFDDGRGISVVANLVGAGSGASIGSKSSRPRTFFPEIPRGRRVVLLNAHGNGFDVPTDPAAVDVDPWFQPAGYVSSYQTATIDVLKDPLTYEDAAVVHITSHGGPAAVRTSAATFDPATSGFALWTSTCVNGTTEGSDVYAKDFEAGAITYMVADSGETVLSPGCWGQPDDRGRFVRVDYGITPAFVKAYVKLDRGALVFVNTCNGMSDGAAEFRSEVFASGASLYAGWTGPSGDRSDTQAAAFVFDRLLGANRYMPESPPQRPCGWEETRDSLFAHGLGTNPNGSTLAFEENPDPSVARFGGLVPILRRLDVDSMTIQDGYVGVSGSLFGVSDGSDHDGALLLGGQPLPGFGAGTLAGDPATPSLALGSLPDDRDPASGPLQLVWHGHPSNPLRLTEWQGVVHLKRRSTYALPFTGELDEAIDLQVRLRGLPTAPRGGCGAPPAPPSVMFGRAMDVRIIAVTVTGTYQDTSPTPVTYVVTADPSFEPIAIDNKMHTFGWGGDGEDRVCVTGAEIVTSSSGGATRQDLCMTLDGGCPYLNGEVKLDPTTYVLGPTGTFTCLGNDPHPAPNTQDPWVQVRFDALAPKNPPLPSDPR